MLSAADDFHIRVWQSNNGKLEYILQVHEHHVFVLEAHPTEPRIFLSAGYDGLIVLWDLSSSCPIEKLYNQSGRSLFANAAWSPNGTMFACTDLNGQVSHILYRPVIHYQHSLSHAHPGFFENRLTQRMNKPLPKF